MKQAVIMLRKSDSYRRDAFIAGLTRHGFQCTDQYNRNPSPDDVCLMWNRNRGLESIAALYEAKARLLVAENGFFGEDPKGGKLYALALDNHLGAGRWFIGDKPRRSFDQKEWRAAGDHVVVLPQRGIGKKGVAMPFNWDRAIVRQLAKITDRKIIVRKHPGASRADPWPDLKGAHCAVTWASGAGIKSIAHGIPVFHGLGDWIGKYAALPLESDLEKCFIGDRSQLWHRLSWAQWTIDEIQSGEAFDGILNAGSDRLLRTPQRQIQNGGGSHGSRADQAQNTA